jgi:uncharacterized protein (TIGR03083 family)
MPSPEVIVVDLFPPMLHALLTLLSGLSDDEWRRPTACAGWSVKDVAGHMFAGDLGNLSRQRDRWPSGIVVRSPQDLVVVLNAHNEHWVQAARFVSPRALRALLEVTGEQVCAYFASLDPHATGDVVSWAGPEPAPVWLDLAREYTERWHHQQHIREAVGRPGLTEPRFLAPVLATFVRALPLTYRDVDAKAESVVVLTITGPSGGRWALRKDSSAWTLEPGAPGRGDAEVVIDEDTAWRVFTKGLDRERAARKVELIGDRRLGAKLLETVAIIA